MNVVYVTISKDRPDKVMVQIKTLGHGAKIWMLGSVCALSATHIVDFLARTKKWHAERTSEFTCDGWFEVDINVKNYLSKIIILTLCFARTPWKI